MSVAHYIVLQREIANLDHGVNGKSLGRSSNVLDTLAKEVGVRPLIEFFSANPDELTAFAESEGLVMAANPPAEQWFPAEEGLRTVRALMQAAKVRKIERLEDIMRDLEEFQKVLEVASENDVGWHLAVDF
jgi:hypothetical protein